MNKKNIFGEQEVNKKTTFNEEVIFENNVVLNKTIQVDWSSPEFLRRNVNHHPTNPPLDSMTIADGINQFFFKPKRPYVITDIFFTSGALPITSQPFVYNLDIREYVNTNSTFSSNIVNVGVSVSSGQPVANSITLSNPIVINEPYINVRIIRRNPGSISGLDHVTVVLKGYYEINI